MPSGFSRFGHLSFLNYLVFWKVKLAGLNDLTEKVLKSVKKILMIHSAKMDQHWSFLCQVWSNHQDQEVLLWNGASETVEAIEIAEADEVIKAAEILKPGKSLMKTSESSRFWFSALFWCFEKNKIWGRIMKYHFEF